MSTYLQENIDDDNEDGKGFNINMIVCSKKRDPLYFTSEKVRKRDRAEELKIPFTSQMIVTE